MFTTVNQKRYGIQKPRKGKMRGRRKNRARVRGREGEQIL